MNLHRLLILGVAVVAVTACSSDNTSPKVVTPGPAGLVRFINAVPDTGAMDFRFIDAVEGVPNVEFVNLAFRAGGDVAYQRVSTGSHHIRVFMSSGLSNFDPAVVSTVMADTTFTFVEGVHYTFLFSGSARSKTTRFTILTDSFTFPSGISIQALNATNAAADFYVSSGTATPTAVSGTPTFAAVAPNTSTAYTPFAVASSSGNYAVAATPAGTTTPVWASLLPVGSPAAAEVPGVSGALSAISGSRIAGSIFTAILFPASVTGSKAATFASAGIVLVADRRF